MRNPLKPFHLKVLPLLMLPFGLVSCDKGGEIKVYSVAKDQANNPHDQGNPHGKTLPPVDMGGAVGEAGADPHATLKVMPAQTFDDEAPEHWQAKERTAMRMASYQVAGEEGAVADISFTSLRSAPGGLLANINRWRSQVGQAPWTEEQLSKNTSKVPSFFGEAVVLDVSGLMEHSDPKIDGRIIGTIVEQDGRAWFCKMRGNAELLGREKENFLTWVGTLKPVDKVETVETVEAIEQPEIPMPDQGDGKVTWQLPEGWKRAEAGRSRYATLKLPAAGDSTSEVAVSFFPGDVGGDVANVNRWRRQVGLQPLDADGVRGLMQTVSAGDKQLSLVDMKGPESRVMAAWIRHGDHTWFFKWTADAAVVEAGKETFRAWLETIRFNSSDS